MKKYTVIGVDEAGRGPLAGPIAVGAVVAIGMLKVQETSFENSRCGRQPRLGGVRDKEFSKLSFRNIVVLKNIKDSKKLSAKKREEWRAILKKNFEYRVAMVGPAVIDKIGISRAAKLAVARVLAKFSKKPYLVLLDGSLFAPKKYHQKTIVKGDEKIPLISAASVFAKCGRDGKMLNFHKKFPKYHFDSHKGYGTKLHYKMIKKHGLCLIHRRSFCKNYLRKFLN